MSGFRKCRIYPLNPGQIDDRQLAPSKVFSKSAEELEKPSAKSATIQFTEKEETLYQKRFEEGYDVPDPKYEAWVSLNHPASCTSRSDVSPVANPKSLPSSTTTSSDVLSDLLSLPLPQRSSKKKKASVNSKAVCITDEKILEELKSKEKEKAEAEAKKERKKKRKWFRRR